VSKRMTASSAESTRGSTFAGRMAGPGAAAKTSTATGLAAAGFVSRSMAMAIDLFVITSAAVAAVASFVPLIYLSAAVAITGRTVGKAVMGIRVVGLDGQPLHAARSLLRTVAYLVSLLPLFAGFLWALVDRERRRLARPHRSLPRRV
jgi:uncharacterized RDD family membrane protein YckC